MPIVVRRDPDYLGAYRQIAAMQQSQRALMPVAQDDPEADANPYTMSTRRGAQLSAKLAADRDRLGQKQGPMQDSYAGFNWQNPISIRQTGPDGRPQNLTMYENLGVDPLATGGFGALGTRETLINDYGNMIDPLNMRDRAALGKVVQSRQSMDIVGDDADMFRSADEIEARQYERQKSRKNAELAEQLELRDTYDAKKRDRDFERKQAEENSQAQREFEIRQAALDAAEDPSQAPQIQKERENIRNQIAAIKIKIAKMPESARASFEAAANPILKELQDRMYRLKAPDQYGERVLEMGADGRQYYRQQNLSGGPDRYSPVISGAIKPPPKTPEQKLQEDAALQRQRLTIQKEFAKTPNEAQQLQDRARRSLEADINRITPPTEQEILDEVREIQKINQQIQPSVQSGASTKPQNYTPVQALVSSGRGQVETDPIKVTSIEEVGQLPSGTYFQDPEGNLRRVP